MSEKTIIIYSNAEPFIDKTTSILNTHKCIAIDEEFFLTAAIGDSAQDISMVISDDSGATTDLEKIIRECRRIDPTVAHIHVCDEQDTERIRRLHSANVFEFIDKNINDALFRRQCERVLNEENIEKIVFMDNSNHGEISLDLRMKYFEAFQSEVQRQFGRPMTRDEQKYFYPMAEDSHLISVDYILEDMSSSIEMLINRKSVLVVDDEDVVREGITRHLKRLGLKTTEASDGREALAIIKKQPVDLMLLDVKMTDMNGDELLKTLKDQNRAIPTVMVSGNFFMDLVQRCFEYGAESYVIKPFVKELFITRVKKVLLKSILKESFETHWQAFLKKKLRVQPKI